MSRSRVLVGLLGLGALVLLAWLLMREDPDAAVIEDVRSPGNRDSEEAPRLTANAQRERTDVGGGSAAEREPGAAPRGDVERELELRGVVVDESGEPIPRATVFVLPKEIDDVPLGGLAETPHVETDEEGRWKLTRSSAAPYWLGAMAWDYLPAHLDGDVIDPGVDQKFALKRSEPLVLEIQDAEGQPAEGATVIVETRYDDPSTLR